MSSGDAYQSNGMLADYMFLPYQLTLWIGEVEGLARKPPSRIRYERSHPVISIRVSMNYYRRLRELKERRGISWAQLIREILADADKSYREGYDAGYQEGYRDGYRKGRIEAELERVFDLPLGSLKAKGEEAIY